MPCSGAAVTTREIAREGDLPHGIDRARRPVGRAYVIEERKVTETGPGDRGDRQVTPRTGTGELEGSLLRREGVLGRHA
jgi:hypothetical protein